MTPLDLHDLIARVFEVVAAVGVAVAGYAIVRKVVEAL